MGIVPELRDQRDLFGWAKRLAQYLRSAVLRAGRGILLQQTDSGTTVSLGNHAADHAPGGKDEVVFQRLEISAGDPEKTIELDPEDAGFLPERVFSVSEDGTVTEWRSLVDLLNGLTGFAGDRVLKVNAEGTALEFGEAGGGGTVLEDETTPIQAGKLMIGAAAAHTLMGTTIGVNLAGNAYQGYQDNAVSSDARVAQIADSRFNANMPVTNITGTGTEGQIALFNTTHGVTSATLQWLLNQLFGASSPSKVIYSGPSGVTAGTLLSVDPSVITKSGTPQDFNIAYFYGGNVIKGLAQPSVDSVLCMDGGTIGLRWVARSGAVQSSGGTGVSLVTADGKIKTIYGV